MRVFMIGGAGAMALGTISALIREEFITEICIADIDEARVQQRVAAINHPKVSGTTCNAYESDLMAQQLSGYDICANAATYTINLSLMNACLKAGANYVDLGGMYYNTIKQLEYDKQFVEKGLSAICGMGAGPGTTNVLGGWCCKRLDSVEKLKLQAGIGASTKEEEQAEFFIPPYSITTILTELTEPCYGYFDGEMKELNPWQGGEVVDFGEPVGRKLVFYTLHSEPLVFHKTFHDKGIEECTFQIGLPGNVVSTAKLFISAGFAMKDIIQIGREERSAGELLEIVIKEHLFRNSDKLPKQTILPEVVRAHAIGKKNNKKTEIIADMVTPEGWNELEMVMHPGTSIGLSTGIEMIHKGLVEKGAGAAEKMIKDYEYYIERHKNIGFQFRASENTLE